MATDTPNSTLPSNCILLLSVLTVGYLLPWFMHVQILGFPDSEETSRGRRETNHSRCIYTTEIGQHGRSGLP